MASRKLLSLCMITKNDEKHLPNCLKNIKSFVDEIVIVDIGSRDSTIKIAEKAGAYVYKMEWDDDYSKAKNFCLDKANGRWILFIQANETISTEQLEKVPPLLDNPNVEGYLLHIDYCCKNYRIYSPVQSLRLFRNRKEYRYKYKAFERIPDEILGNIKDADIMVVQNDDYKLSMEFESLVSLLEEDLKQNMEDSYLQYMYGIELLNQKKYEESIAFFQRACKNVNFDYLFVPHLYKCLSWVFIYLKRYTEALDVLNDAIKLFPFYTDLLVLRGELYRQLNKYREAIQDLEKSLKVLKVPNLMVPIPEIDISIIIEILAEIHEQIFNYRKALDYYCQSYNLNNNHDIIYKIGELAKKVDCSQILEDILKIAMEQGDLQQLIILMDVYFQQRQYIKVLEQVEYLESLIGKSDQTESIKFFCYMMLGKVEDAKKHYVNIDKKSPFYSHMLLQRVERCWSNNEWQEAIQLMKEVDGIENIEPSIKRLYNSINSLFIKNEKNNILLSDQEYEIVIRLMKDFLWLGQKEKAQALLSLFLDIWKEEQCVELAEMWAEINDYKTIERIFLCISNKKNQLEFKQKIIEILLRCEYIESAEKLAGLGEYQQIEILEYVLWSKSLINKLEKWVEKVSKWNENIIPYELSVFENHTKPNKSLLEFYNSLRLTKKDMNENSFDIEDTELTNVKIHEKIGDIYIERGKKREAFFAYLKALQWDPLDKVLQEKMINVFNENSSEFYNFLKQGCLKLEGTWFKYKKEFINYIQGITYFKNQQFEKALSYFLKIKEYETLSSITIAYIISSLWIVEKEEQADKWLKKQNEIFKILSLCLKIYKNYILDVLDKAYQQYPYSELIMIEKQRVLNSKY